MYRLTCIRQSIFARRIFRASITGTAGTSKTILVGHFAMSSCKRKETTLFFSFEESPDQLVRNMATIGINFKQAIKSKLLYIQASRPSLLGLEMHLMVLNKLLEELKPRTVIIDPIRGHSNNQQDFTITSKGIQFTKSNKK